MTITIDVVQLFVHDAFALIVVLYQLYHSKYEFDTYNCSKVFLLHKLFFIDI